MKKIILYLICLGFLLPAAVGCADKLETIPTTDVDESMVWKSKDDFQRALNAVYMNFQWKSDRMGRMSNFMPSYDCMTDNAHRGEDGTGDYGTMLYVTGLLNPTSTGHVTLLYEQAYSCITQANLFLSKLEPVENPATVGMTAAEKSDMEAQAYFLRGYAYWMLHLFYGEVPIVTELLDLETQYQPKSSRSDVYNHVIGDFNRAIGRFSQDQTYSGSGGKATKNAARGMKARAMMFEAFDANGNADVAKVTAAAKVLDSITGYSLNPEYAYNYYPTTQEASPEIMFSIKFLSPSSWHYNDRIFGLDNGMYPTDDLYNAYYKDASGVCKDTRRLKTFNDTVQTYQWIGGPVIEFSAQPYAFNYRRPIKQVSPLPLPSGGTMWEKETPADQDAIVIRWGEVMLLRAEAAVEMGELGVAESLVNQIRARGTGLSPLAAGLSQSQMRDSVRHERRVETAYESGLRYYDLKRWNTMETRLKEAFNNDPNYNNVKPTWTRATMYDLPLPQSEIDKSRGILVQNPIWSGR